MLDHRALFPVGTMMAKGQDKEPCLFVYGQQVGQERMLASLAMRQKGKYRLVSIPDIADGDKDVVINYDNYSPETFKQQAENHEINREYAVHKEFPQSNTVVIVAPGNVLSKDIEYIYSAGIPVVTVSRAILNFPISDYAVVSDYRLAVYYNIKRTVGVLCTHCYPDIIKSPWEDITWFTHLPCKLDGIPYTYQTEGVITDALWFAIKGLGAKKIIMLGVEQPATNKDYFWEGIFLQAHCYWYSKHGTEIWNCTSATSVIAGVILGTLEEICQ